MEPVEVSVVVNTEQMDVAVEKTERLIELIESAISAASELSEIAKTINLSVDVE